MEFGVCLPPPTHPDIVLQDPDTGKDEFDVEAILQIMSETTKEQFEERYAEETLSLYHLPTKEQIAQLIEMGQLELEDD